MKVKCLFLMLCGMLLIVPCILRADNNAHVIQLIEIPSSDEDTGRDDPGAGYDPTSPNGYSAIITGHVLSVAVSSSLGYMWTPQLRVYKADGTLVTRREFRRVIHVTLADNGYYTMYLTLGNRTFQGSFEITD